MISNKSGTDPDWDGWVKPWDRQSSERGADGPTCISTGAKKWKLMWTNICLKLMNILLFRVLQKCEFQACDDVLLTGTIHTEASDKNKLEIH